MEGPRAHVALARGRREMTSTVIWPLTLPLHESLAVEYAHGSPGWPAPLACWLHWLVGFLSLLATFACFAGPLDLLAP